MASAVSLREGLLGFRAAAACGGDEECEPESAASVVGCGSGRHEPDAGGPDRRDGPADVARLGPPVQRARPGWPSGQLVQRPEPRLSQEQRTEITQLVETGPDKAVHGVVRWRRMDLQRVILDRFGVAYHERTIGKLLKALGFSHVSSRPRHPAQDASTIEAFKKTSRPR